MPQPTLPRLARRTLLAFALCSIALLLFFAQPAHAACGGSTDVGTAAALNVAINDFNAQAGPCAFTITLSNDILLTVSTPPINNSNGGAELTIAGMGHTVNGQDISGVRPFTIDSGTTVTLEEITITRGKVDNALGGGGIYTKGTLTLMDSSVIDNATTGDGGGIHQDSGTLTLIGSSVIANTGGFNAAGIYQNAGTLTVTDSTITDNIGVTNGGGIYSAAGTATVTNSALTGNGAIFGGGIFNQGSLTVRDSDFTANRSVTGGGGIYNLGTLDVGTTTFSSNVAGTTIEGIGDGGGVYTAQGAATIATSTFTDNRARIDGGGIHHEGGALDVIASTFIANQARLGGGLHNVGTVTVTNSTFSGNIGNFAGGGIYNEETLTLISSTVAGNSGAANQGGGVVTNGSVGSGTLNLNNNVIANNTNGDCYNISDSGMVSAAYTLIGDSGTFGCGLAAANPGSNGNLIGVDPQLEALANNGGPTETHALQAGSPAIDAIPSGAAVAAADGQAVNLVCNGLVPDTDQRGFPRPAGSGCDIGAFEFDPTVPVTLGWFLAARNGEGATVDFRWQTATETGTAGFNLLAAGADGPRTRLNPALIQSAAIDSVEPLDYGYQAATDGTSFFLEELSIDGKVSEFGPFALGVEFGSYSLPSNVELSKRVWLPLVVEE